MHAFDRRNLHERPRARPCQIQRRCLCRPPACCRSPTTMFASPASPRVAAAPEEEGKVFSNPLASHPITADPAAAAMLRAKGGDLEASPASSSIGSPSRSGGGSSSGSGGGAGGSKGGGGGGDGHLRRMTQNLVDILESMSGSVQSTSGGGSKGGRGGLASVNWLSLAAWDCLGTPGHASACRLSLNQTHAPMHPCSPPCSPPADALPGVQRRPSTMMAARGDSVATMADLEAGRGGAGGEEEQVVPVQHVRRLTTTLVDILRHVAASGQPREQQVGGRVCRGVGSTWSAAACGIALGAPHKCQLKDGRWLPHCADCCTSCLITCRSLLPCHALQDGRDPEIVPAEGAGLLDNASELSYSDDKLSLSSASTTGGDAATALLRAAFMKDEYRGEWLAACVMHLAAFPSPQVAHRRAGGAMPPIPS